MTAFEDYVIKNFGEEGRQWLASLPEKIEALTVKWDLQDITPTNLGNYCYLLKCRLHYRTNAYVFIKLTPDVISLEREYMALKFFRNRGAAQVYYFDKELCALSIAELSSRESLRDKKYTFEQTALIFLKVLQRLRFCKVKPNPIFPDLSVWLRALDQDWGLPADLVELARSEKNRLLATPAAPPCLLHGDLHHDNILFFYKSWYAIDPKGIYGEPLYDVVAFIRNPIDELIHEKNLRDILAKRINYFSVMLTADPERLASWCFVQSMASASWAVEDGEDPAPHLLQAECFKSLMNCDMFFP